MSASRTPGNHRDQLREQPEQVAQRARERRLTTVMVLVVVLLVVGGGTGFQFWRTSRAPSAAPATAGTFAPVRVVAGEPLVLGVAPDPAQQRKAPVRVQLYEDFHCQHCAEFEDAFGPTLTAAQTDGKIAIELYPMSFIDQGSAAAANAMACAADAGFGQSYYLGLFANHTLRWRDSQLIDLTAKAGTTVPPSFNACVTGRSQQEWVSSINTTAQRNGVTATPTMFVDHAPVDIAKLTPESLSSMIDRAVSQ